VEQVEQIRQPAPSITPSGWASYVRDVVDQLRGSKRRQS
jgi:hypothetical protein